jgi:putative phage-type endonuclease
VTPAERHAWLAERRTGIGGSDVAAILGLSPWRTPVQVWLDKTGQAEDQPESAAMHWGNVLEEPIAQEYAASTGRGVIRWPKTIRHPSLPFLANVDRLVVGWKPIIEIEDAERGLECKTAGGPFAAEPWADGVPMYYVSQCQWYMGITHLPRWDVAALIGGSDFRIYEMAADPDLQGELHTRCLDWWQRYVLGNTPPPAVDLEDVKPLYRKSRGTPVTATDEIHAKLLSLRGVRAEASELTALGDRLQMEVCDYMKDADTLTGSDGERLATWKTTKAGTRVFKMK